MSVTVVPSRMYVVACRSLGVDEYFESIKLDLALAIPERPT